MKRFIYINTLIATFLCMTATSCMNKDADMSYDSPAGFYPSYQNIVTTHVIDGGGYYFTLDNGTSLFVRRCDTPFDAQGNDGKRAIIYYDFLSSTTEGFDRDIVVYTAEPILTKQVEKAATAEEAAAFGIDAISIDRAWISGSWLNISYTLPSVTTSRHRISLVDNAAAEHDVPEGYIYLEFRHDTHPTADFTTIGSTYSWSYVCYALGEYHPTAQGKSGLYLRYEDISEGTQFLKVEYSAE